MFLPESEAAIAAGRQPHGRVRPCYESWCFSRLPASVLHALGCGPRGPALPVGWWNVLQPPYDEVILFYLDAFGWRAFERQRTKSALLRDIEAHGVVAQLTSAFPSTTSVHTTLIHSGLLPPATGIFEWFVYEPHVDAVIAPLLHSFAGDTERETLQSPESAPTEILPRRTVYQQLGAHAVRSHVYQDRAYAASTFSTTVTRGAVMHPFATLDEMLSRLEEARKQSAGPTYHLLYYDRIDALCHLHGPDSATATDAIAQTLQRIEDLIRRAPRRDDRKTLVLITADHGQLGVDPAATVRLNEIAPELLPLLRTTRAGRPIVPVGSARDFFIHAAPGRTEDVTALLETKLAGEADILQTRDLLAAGYFGPNNKSEFLLERMGEILILPRANHMVWWHDPPRFSMAHHGMHGGMALDEMLIPLLALTLD